MRREGDGGRIAEREGKEKREGEEQENRVDGSEEELVGGGGEDGRRGMEGLAEVNLVHLYAHHLKAGREGGK